MRVEIYKLPGCIVRVHGPREPKNIKEATRIFLKEIQKKGKNNETKN